jgi:hypothetical protein
MLASANATPKAAYTSVVKARVGRVAPRPPFMLKSATKHGAQRSARPTCQNAPAVNAAVCQYAGMAIRKNARGAGSEVIG